MMFVPSHKELEIKEMETMFSKSSRLQEALNNPKWIQHHLGDKYTMDNKPEFWKITYYPIFECGKTGEVYEEPRALVEKPIKGGIDFREVPLRYLTKIQS